MEKPPKRLRGWKLEKVKASPSSEKHPCQKDVDDSPLVTRLLELWSQGRISASQAAEIAHLASLEGANSQEVLKIARCGNFQQSPGNSHRDMMQLFLKGLQLCDPWPVNVEVKDPKSQKYTTTEASVMLPHLLFSSLYEHYRDQFEELFAVKECASFWHNLEKKEDPRLVPPITLDKRVVSPSTTIPIFAHGDGVEFVRDSSLMTFSWGSMLSQQSSLATHLLLTAWPKSCQTPDTWKPLDKIISWSFSALAKGFHPTEDWDGKALTKGILFEKAGLPLTKGKFRAVIYSIQGDQEFYSNCLELGHWQSKHPCHECDSQKPHYKKKACPPGKSFKILKQDLQTYVDVTPGQALLVERSHPIFSVPGVSSALVRADSLHILYSRGVGSHLAGSLLHYCCYFDGSSRQKKPPATRLQTLFAKIKELYSLHRVSCRLTNIRLSMFTDVTAPHKKFPCLDAKAAETKHLLPCLLQVLKQALPEGAPIHTVMLECLETFIQLGVHFDEMDLFPTAEQHAQTMDLAKRFFDTYQDLHEWALSKGKKLFNITFKFHSSKHMYKNSYFLNYRIHSNFRSEDFVGHLSRLAHSVSFGVSAPRLCGKVCQKYRVLLHLQLTRAAFGCSFESTDDP